MNDWLSLTALASTIALAGPDHVEPNSEIGLRVGHHATRNACAVDAVPFKHPKHVDPLTRPGHRLRCVERRRLNGRCLHVQVSVVRDHDGSFLVDLETEPDLGPGPDTLQQYRAQTVPGLAERGSILARQPGPNPRIAFSSTNPLAQRLGRTAHLRRHRNDGCPLRFLPALGVQDQPHCPFLKLRGVSV